MGTTGGLQPVVKPGDLVIATGAVRGDCASRHYAPLSARVLISFWRITITDRGLYYAAAIAFRIINLIFVSMLLLMILTRKDDLVNGLRLLGVPYKVSFTLGTALRFVPTVVGEALMVIDAQKARG